MTIRFPPERRQQPPNYPGARAGALVTTRQTTRAIVHPEAVRISRTREPILPASTAPVAPHAITFAQKRPPPGTIVVDVSQARAQIRAVVHAEAARVPRPRPVIERASTEPVKPHRIAFTTSIAAPRYH